MDMDTTIYFGLSRLYGYYPDNGESTGTMEVNRKLAVFSAL